MKASTATRTGLRWRVPPQHGAWAFLIVPLLLGALLGAASLLGLAFAVAWIAAYPTTYFAGRSLVARMRRGSWTGFARREGLAALPWAAITTLMALPLLVFRPWIVIPGVVCLGVWGISVALTWAGRERGLANDLVLVALASIATPLMWAVANGQARPAGLPASVWWAALICAMFFTGSVLHVKSLIREAADRRWHWASVAFHVLALVAMCAISWWLAIPFGLALGRTAVMRPGLAPGRIGAVESVVAVLIVACGVLALA